jgi:hypothetical protein
MFKIYPGWHSDRTALTDIDFGQEMPPMPRTFAYVRVSTVGQTTERRVLRGFVGIAPEFPEALRARRTRAPPLPVAERWERRPSLSRGSPAWRYLTAQRGLPETILADARAADAIREGPRGSAWFAHRDGAGRGKLTPPAPMSVSTES